MDKMNINVFGEDITLKKKKTDDGRDYWTSESPNKKEAVYSVESDGNDFILRDVTDKLQ